jgi:hypothetical protein
MTAPTPEPSAALPASPCVRQCCLDEADVCLGCGRTLEEIKAWHTADAEARARILADAEARRRTRR